MAKHSKIFAKYSLKLFDDSINKDIKKKVLDYNKRGK